MFADVDADVYVLADGDGTYDPTDAPAMLDRLMRDNLDMVVGCRVPAPGDLRTFPRGHVVGNCCSTGSSRHCSGEASPTSSRVTG